MKNTIKKIKKCFSKETCYHGDKERWSEKNPTTGHCAVAAILFQSIYGGIVCKTTVNRHTHYFNKVGEMVVDITAEQFGNTVIHYENCAVCNVKNMLKNKDNKTRYELLKEKFISLNTKEE